MLSLIWEHLWFTIGAASLVVVVLAIVASSIRIVHESESGLIVKRFGPPLLVPRPSMSLRDPREPPGSEVAAACPMSTGRPRA